MPFRTFNDLRYSLIGYWLHRLRGSTLEFPCETAQVARHVSDHLLSDKVTEWRREYERLDHWTWGLFYWQLGMFALQVLGLLLSLGITYGHKLA